MLALIEGLNHWQICGLAFWLLLQGCVFSPFPEEVIVLSLGVFWSQGRVSFPEALLAVLCGLLPANSIMVFVGGKFSKKSLIQKPMVQRALQALRRKGRWVIFITRFTPFIRGPVYASAGLSGMRVIDFFKVDASAALIQIPGLILLGAFIGEKSGSISNAYKIIGVGGLSMAAIVFTGIALWERFSRKASVPTA